MLSVLAERHGVAEGRELSHPGWRVERWGLWLGECRWDSGAPGCCHWDHPELKGRERGTVLPKPGPTTHGRATLVK